MIFNVSVAPRKADVIVPRRVAGQTPLISFALGDDIDTFLASCVAELPILQMRAADMLIIGGPIDVVCRGPLQGGFELPPSKVAMLSFIMGTLVEARICPHTTPLTDEDAHEVASNVVHRLNTANYRSVAGFGRGVDSLRALLGNRNREIVTTVPIGKWTRGNDAVFVDVERTCTEERRNSALLHAVRVRVENPVLYRKVSAGLYGGHQIVWKRRRTQSGPPERAEDLHPAGSEDGRHAE